ncbi:hypothetical protein CgunFtcFv8_003477 [Champsocephalus gunnari]|uniref:Uncharacterized protein n=1 Tax=Champsocephalus gunnari TaxID=52237 RepID=A0AAN8DAY2_CHAGU|nr:hypothetical protein CgunFtcFv8_003477 [Champsocephalus gunnari]
MALTGPDGLLGLKLPDSHARLMNCEMRQTYKSCVQPRPGLSPPPSSLLPSVNRYLCMTVSAMTLASIFTLTCCWVLCVSLLGAMETQQPVFGSELMLMMDR